MRTTIRIDDELFRRLKVRAAETKRTIGSLVEDAVRTFLARDRGATTSVAPLTTVGGSGVVAGVDLTSNAALLEAMDDDGLDARR